MRDPAHDETTVKPLKVAFAHFERMATLTLSKHIAACQLQSRMIIEAIANSCRSARATPAFSYSGSRIVSVAWRLSEAESL